MRTLARRSGSCRDFAVLFVDAVRSLGFGARIVSGYLYDPDLDMRGSTGAGSTHAWAEGYVPGAGWITFDPTNRSVGGFNLIPVAMARHISQTMPVSGSFAGDVSAFLGLEVTVTVTSSNQSPVVAAGSDREVDPGNTVSRWVSFSDTGPSPWTATTPTRCSRSRNRVRTCARPWTGSWRSSTTM